MDKIKQIELVISKLNIKDKNLKFENKKLKKSLLKEKIKNEFLKQMQSCDQILKNNQNSLNSKLLKWVKTYISDNNYMLSNI